MPPAYAFWGLMIAWAIFAGISWQKPERFGPYGYLGSSALVFALLALLGWHVFGPALK